MKKADGEVYFVLDPVHAFDLEKFLIRKSLTPNTCYAGGVSVVTISDHCGNFAETLEGDCCVATKKTSVRKVKSE